MLRVQDGRETSGRDGGCFAARQGRPLHSLHVHVTEGIRDRERCLCSCIRASTTFLVLQGVGSFSPHNPPHLLPFPGQRLCSLRYCRTRLLGDRGMWFMNQQPFLNFGPCEWVTFHGGVSGDWFPLLVFVICVTGHGLAR